METSTYWNLRRVFITGASGLLGSALTRTLADRGSQITVLLRDPDPQTELIRSGTIRRVTVVQGSLEDYASIERAINENECDTVFHLGAQTIVGTALRSPLATFEANIRGTYNLLEACRVHSSLVRSIVIASSDKAYGSSDVLPYTEEHPLVGKHPYDVSKSCTDLLTSTYTNSFRTPACILRCGNIFGGGDLNWSRLIPGTIRSLVENTAPIIRSDGKFLRDYIYVQDVVEAYLSVAERLASGDSSGDSILGEAFNISPEKALSVLEVVATLQKLLGKEHLQPVIQNKATSEIRDQYLDCSKAKRMLNWSHRYSFEQAAQETVDWYRRYLAG